MLCGLIFGLLSVVTGIRMIRTGEGPDLRQKRLGNVSRETAIKQGKGAILLGVIIILFSIFYLK